MKPLFTKNLLLTTVSLLLLTIDQVQATEVTKEESKPKSNVIAQESNIQPAGLIPKNTKLNGEIIFGVGGALSGDLDKNSIFGHRTRLEVTSKFAEDDELLIRLQAEGFGEINNSGKAASPEGGLFFAGGTDSKVKVDALKYEFPLGDNTRVALVANGGAADDFADTINPYFDGDGGSGALSTFASRPSIYLPVGQAGVGIRHKLDDKTEVSLGYMADTANDATAGLFGGTNSLLAQVAYQPNDTSRVALTYVNSRKAPTGTGSNNVQTFLGDSSANSFGVQGYFAVNPQLTLGGWVGYTSADSVNNGNSNIWNWAVTAALPNVGQEGNLLGFLVGQEPKVTSGKTIDPSTSLHLEGFYQIKVNDNLSITPSLIYLTAPDHNNANGGSLLGVVRSTFTF